jgi:hypothetical protein
MWILTAYTRVMVISLLTRSLDVDINILNYCSGRLFIDSDVGCGF